MKVITGFKTLTEAIKDYQNKFNVIPNNFFVGPIKEFDGARRICLNFGSMDLCLNVLKPRKNPINKTFDWNDCIEFGYIILKKGETVPWP